MAGNENRRRKKIEAQRAKKKAHQKALARVQSSGMIAKLTVASKWPLIETRMTAGGPREGIGSMLITRRGPHGQVAGVVFLVDAYCLGVKDIVLFLGSETEWQQRTQGSKSSGPGWEDVPPEYLRKYVEGAVAYARSIGLPPYRDWAHAAPIFGDIDASQCLTEFTYGLNGKPFYVQGPHDTPERVRQIMSALNQNDGQGNLMLSLSGADDDFDDDFDDDSDDDDEELVEHLEQE